MMKNLLRHQISYFGVGGLERRPADLRRPRKRACHGRVIAHRQKAHDHQGIFQAWRSHVKKPAGLEKFNIREESAGPPGEDLEIRLSGGIPEKLKAASLPCNKNWEKFPDCHLPRDDLRYGKEQAVFSLTPLGRALGLTVEDVAAQLRDALTDILCKLL